MKVIRKYKKLSSFTKSVISSVGLAVITLGLIATTVLVQQSQDLRSKAATNTIEAPLSPEDQPVHYLFSYGVEPQPGGTYIVYAELRGQYLTNPLFIEDQIGFDVVTQNPTSISEESEGWFGNCPDDCGVAVSDLYDDVIFDVRDIVNTWSPSRFGPIGQQNPMGYVRIEFASNPGCVQLNPKYTNDASGSFWNLQFEGAQAYSTGRLFGWNTCGPNPLPTPLPTGTVTPTPTATITVTPTPTSGPTVTPTPTTLPPCTIINNGTSMTRADTLRVSGNYGETVSIQNLSTGTYLVNNVPYTLNANQSLCGGDGYVVISSTSCSPNIQVGNVLAAISSDGSTDTIVVSSDGCNTTPTPTPQSTPTFTPTPTVITPTPLPSPGGDCQCDLWYVTENNCGGGSIAICTGNFSCSCAAPGQSPGWCGNTCSNNTNCQPGLTCNQTTFTCGGAACSSTPTPTPGPSQDSAKPSLFQRTINFFRSIF